ncbi:MAG: hypothetical protein WCJ61_14440 [Paludibacter sp.]
MKILICPLNWGLGHATRCVPIIQQLIAEGHELVLVSDGFPLQFLRQEFPSIRIIELPSYPIQYSDGKSQVAAMFRSFPAIVKGIINEHNWLKKLLRNEHFDQIISDNRFGMWNKKVHSIYITHQLMIKMPKGLKLFEPLVWLMHRCIINRYNECWIPDTNENGGLSGDLSHKYPLPRNAKFIGILSRFKNIKKIQPNTNFEVVAVLSGVEPQRTMLEKELIQRYNTAKHQTIIVMGQPREVKKEIKIGNITFVSHLSSIELAEVLVGAKHIISRSGYSTIMDLATLNCLQKAELIPTPGQTEQEYLFQLTNENKLRIER